MIRPTSRSNQSNFSSLFIYACLALAGLPPAQIRGFADPINILICSAQGNQQPRLLEPGNPTQRELTGSQSHSYQMTLTDGQYFKVIVDQRGVDISLELIGPDGKQVTESDTESRLQGQEIVEWVAEEAGSYRLDVLANFKNAAAGRYEIQMVELRIATENDRILHESRKLKAEILRLDRAGKFDEALPLAERELAIREKVLGPEHFEVANSLNNLAIVYSKKGIYEKAESLFQRALTIREKVLGPEHPAVALTLNNLANLYIDRSEYAKAEPLYERALSIREKALGPEHPAVAQILNEFAFLYTVRGEYAKAEPMFQRALAIREKVLGAEHPAVAASLNNLAKLYRDRAIYVRAEPLYKRALAIREKVLGPEHPAVALTLNNLANLYMDRRDYVMAEPLFQRALTIKEKALGAQHPIVAQALNDLAILYSETGNYERAGPLFHRALTIMENTLGPEHPNVAQTLNNLGKLYSEGKGNYTKAEPIFRRAQVIWEKVLGPDHPAVASVLFNLAVLYRKSGTYSMAIPHYERALNMWGKSLGPEHPYIAQALNDLSKLYTAKGDIPQAVTTLSQANAVDERNLSLYLTIGSERQKLAYLDLFSKWTNFTLSLQSQVAANDPKALDLAFTTLLQRKGRGLDAMTDTIATLRRYATPQDQKVFDNLKEARSQLATLILKDPSEVKIDTYQTRLKSLKDEVEKLEAELSSRSAEFRNQMRPVTLNAVQAALPADSALVEFALFTPLDPATEESKPPRYIAYLLRSQGQPKWADLGDTALIDQVIYDWRKALRDPNRIDVKRLARIVDEKLMRPIRALLSEMSGDPRRLLIAPDGSLNLIPFAALVDEQNRYLIERYAISYLTSGRDLLRLQTTEPSRDAPLVVANPDFGRLTVLAMQGGRNSRKKPTGNQPRIVYKSLPATRIEALGIKALFPQASVLQQKEAIEAALKHSRGPRILHIASHGFFFSYQSSPPIVDNTPPSITSLITKEPSSARANSYTVQLEANPELETALETIYQLRAQGVNAYIIKSKVKGKGVLFRVCSGDFLTRAEAQKYGADLQEKGVADELFVVRYKPSHGDLMETVPIIVHGTTKPLTSPTATSQPITETLSDLRLSKFTARVKDPLLRSGLALAGANQGRSGDDDGLLTALETASLYLSGTKLVVLSACDTGVGEVTKGEGVQGLRRALVLAGSESQVMSLWPVSDEATKDLMIPYYKALQQGEGRSEGLRQVQLRILRGEMKHRHPFFWAAFIQSGEWANLDGKR